MHCSYTVPAGGDDITFVAPYSAAALSKTRAVAISSGAIAVQGVGNQAFAIKSAHELLALSGKLEMIISAPGTTVAELAHLGARSPRDRAATSGATVLGPLSRELFQTSCRVSRVI